MGKTNSIYFDCKMGVSGDMVLAALLDLGVSVETLKKGLLKLNLGDFDIEIMEEERYGIKGTNVYVKEFEPVSYTHLRAHETRHDLVCRLLLEKKKKKKKQKNTNNNTR